MRRLLCSLLLVPLVALADGPAMTRVLQQTPTPSLFSFCWGGTCAEVLQTSLTSTEWEQVRKRFDPAPENAEAERETIRHAIGLLESLIGSKTGTTGDRAGTFGNSAYPGQLDCNDETTNTTSYLRMMIADGLIQFHEVLDTTTRGGFLIFGRHSSAVIAEKSTGSRFAVDSWFYDNGEPAVILPLAVWKSGWKPANNSAH
jgi:hypothetical protein